ncbi:PD-(D/E)XK nuclease family protein [Alicyclobacillus mengziensis]|uniref:Exodeoxyribonuclease V subunit gamma n=1 Tax=Alicyclobacillus mengziensis TaxID=2931921 RepID=A0A9X7VW62_9BACL|nr:PD-(D/E)XK nuclease family protein [Alicyclobacillus mengziensis]QSO46196.1 exodeoxyribonuclease V subunit gamma [Alicyclobacillus mengziensis]
MGQVELWIGRAGSGKSQRIAERIARDVQKNPLGAKIFWIVPAMISFAAEQRLVRAVPSTVRAEVLPLPRLALRIQSIMRTVDGNPVNVTGQRLILAQVLKEAAAQLNVLHRAKPTLSFLDSILEAFEEMSAHRVSMSKIESMLQVASTRIDTMEHPLDVHAGRTLLGKLGDLCTLYFLYQRALDERNLYDPSELMERVYKDLPDCPLLNGATIYIDGFQDMQPRELHFALGLAQAADNTTLVISGDPSWFTPHSPTNTSDTSKGGGHPTNHAEGTLALTTLLEQTGYPGDVFAPESLRLYQAWMRGCEEAHMRPKVVTFGTREERGGSQLSVSNSGQTSFMDLLTGTDPQQQKDATCVEALRDGPESPETSAQTHSAQSDSRHTESGQTDMLSFLEQNIVSESRNMRPWDRPPVSRQLVRLAAAQNMRAEVEGIAADILSRVYHGDHVFRDMMVIVPNLADYAPLLREVLSRYQIPFDLADPPALTTHPLAKFILAALAAIDEDLSTNSVLRVLKTDFCGLTREDADWLEGYLVLHRIDGSAKWQETWRYAEMASDKLGDDARASIEDARANRLRELVAQYLLPFVHSLRKSECTPREVAEAIWGLLQSVRAKRKVAAWLVDEGHTEDPQAASVHEQAWQRILGILNDLSSYVPKGTDGSSQADGSSQIATADGDPLSHPPSLRATQATAPAATPDTAPAAVQERLLPRGFLFESIRTDIGSQTLSAVPAGLQSVLVTDIERASALHVPIVYVLGLSDGALPRRAHTTGLLQDEERIQFAALFGQRLGDTAADKQVAEQWRVYTALTRATQTLTLCYPLSNNDGKEMRPSSVVNRVQSLFRAGDLEVNWFAEGMVRDVEQTVWTPATALQWLVGTLREARYGASVPTGTSAVYRWLSTNPDYAPRLHRALRGLFQRAEADRLAPAQAINLFGSPMKVNVYQLETYASCPYRHFVQYGLKLSEPAERDGTRAERGTLIHAALAEFVLKWREHPDEWRQMGDVRATAEMGEVFRALLEQPQFRIWSRTRIRVQQAAEALQVAERAAISLTRHARYSRFLPTHLELSFGTDDAAAYPAYAFTLTDGTQVFVRGRIDRIDIAKESGEHRFRVIDYKSRTMDIDLSKIYHGLRLQLPVYTAVVKAQSQNIFGQPSTAGGFFYLPLVRKLETGNQPDEEHKAFEKAISRMKARGLWRDDGVSLGLMDERLPRAIDSEIFPKMYNQDGSIAKQAPVLCETDWDAMEDFVLDKVQELAQAMRRGDISISPYALDRQDIACRTCSFAAICQFDSRWDGSPLRPLEKRKREAVLEEWQRTKGDDAK